MQDPRKRLQLLLALSVEALAFIGCQDRPAFVLQSNVEGGSDSVLADASSTNLSRDQWWTKQIDQVAPTAEEISQDPIFIAAQEEIKLDPFAGCGASSHDAGDALVLPTTHLNSSPSRAVADRVTVFGAGVLDISGTQIDMKSSSIFNVTSTNPNNAQARAATYAQRASSIAQYKNLTQKDVQNAVGAEPAKPVCGFLMTSVMRSVSTNNSTFVNITFNKPVLYHINPKLSPERIKLQLLTPMKIEGLVATIESNDPEVTKQGTQRNGRFEISLLPPQRTVTDTKGVEHRIEGQVAYRVLSKFELPNGAQSQVAALDQVTDYYIKGNVITSVVVLTPKPELPVLVYKTP